MLVSRETMPTPLLSWIFVKLVYGCCMDHYKTYIFDCQKYQTEGYTRSGVYHMIPTGTNNGYDVYCDMETDAGGWLVFQRRIDGSIDFYRDWSEYENGFGNNKSHEHWLVFPNYDAILLIGLRPLKIILSQGFYELRIDMSDFEGNTKYAKYGHIALGDATESYKLTVGRYSGTAGDSFSKHNGYMFSTKDRDNDFHTGSCAQTFKGAWWYNSCHTSNLNGQYFNGSHVSNADGVNWYEWKGWFYSLKSTEMKIRRI